MELLTVSSDYSSFFVQLLISFRFLEVCDCLCERTHHLVPQEHLHGEVGHVFEVAFVQLGEYALVRIVRVWDDDSGLELHRSDLVDGLVLFMIIRDDGEGKVVHLWPVATTHKTAADPLWDTSEVLDCPGQVRLEADDLVVVRDKFDLLHDLHWLPIHAVLRGVPEHIEQHFRWQIQFNCQSEEGVSSFTLHGPACRLRVIHELHPSIGVFCLFFQISESLHILRNGIDGDDTSIDDL